MLRWTLLAFFVLAAVVGSSVCGPDVACRIVDGRGNLLAYFTIMGDRSLAV